MHHYFIINPAAGQGKAAKLVPAIREYMEGEGLPFTIYQTKGVGDAMAYVRYMAKKGPARFYACGGDGTLNEVVNGLKKFPQCQVALIPAGTGNDFLRNFTNMENFQDIAAQVAGEAVAIDVLQVNGRRVVNMTNTGFDSAVVAQVAKLKKIPFVAGPLAYVLAVAVLLARRVLRHPLGTAACFLILSGGVGNILDRVRLGYVVDMFHLEFWPTYPVFNVADICIVCGAVLGAVYYLWLHEPRKKR